MAKNDFSGAWVDSSHDGFDEARRCWNAVIDRSPAVIAHCKTVEDVRYAVRDAADKGIKAIARCGGHSVSGASLPAEGIVVDLAGLNRIEVDPEAQIARVGGGALLGDLDASTQKYGLAVTAGVEPSTGVGGLTLGGGIGFLARKLGLTIDSLERAEIVLANGDVVEASEHNHPDLFWALRGGGGQFGIVTRFDFVLHPIGPQIMVAQAFYPLENARRVMAFLDRFMSEAPDEIGAIAAFMKVPRIAPFPAEWHGKPCVALVLSHTEDGEIGRRALTPATELGNMIFGFVDCQPYQQFQRAFADASPKGGRYYWKSHFFNDLSGDVADILAGGIQALPGEYTQLFIEVMGGAVARVAPDATAFANRSARYNLGISTGWAAPQLDQQAISETRKLFEKLRPYSDGSVYLNYVDRDEVGRAALAFGPNLDRLKRVKHQYDPANLFGGMLGGTG